MKVRMAATAALVGSSVLFMAATGSFAATGNGGANKASHEVTSKASHKVITVLAIQSLSGPLSPEGLSNVAGIKAAVAQINSVPHGPRVDLIVKNDGSVPTQSFSLLQSYLNSGKKPNLLIDGTETANALAMQPLITRYGLVTIGTGNGAQFDPATYPTDFYTGPSLGGMAKSMTEYLQSKGDKSVALIYGDDDYGTQWAAAMSQAFTSAGLTVTASVSFADTALSMTPQLQTLEASNPNVLVAEAYGPPAGYLVEGRAALGWTAPMVGGVTFAAVNMAALAPSADFTGFTMQTPLVETKSYASTHPGLGVLLKYENLYKQQTQPDFSPALNYDSIELGVDAIVKAGSTSGKAVTAELQKLGAVKNTLVQANYGFSSSSHALDSSPSSFTFIGAVPLVKGLFG